LDRNATRKLAGADYALPYQMGKTMEKTIHDWQLPEECRKVIFMMITSSTTTEV